jgi:hypothetical protein
MFSSTSAMLAGWTNAIKRDLVIQDAMPFGLLRGEFYTIEFLIDVEEGPAMHTKKMVVMVLIGVIAGAALPRAADLAQFSQGNEFM